MSGKLHKTKGIVLRAVKYGETSLVVTIFTELFGVQSYMVNGVRTTGKNAPGKASLFQPMMQLELVVYHHELKNLNRIREFKWGYLYKNLMSDVKRNAVGLYMTELLTKCLKQPEANPDLYHFMEDILTHLDEADDTVLANLPLFFALHLTYFFGFRIQDNYSAETSCLDMIEGNFVEAIPHHPHFLADKQAEITARFLKCMQPEDLREIKLNHDFRRNLLYACETYYALHIQDFGTMKTLPVLRAILS
ncbi:MAG: DNA repair protein RecO [Chitinophagaceae bacterium]|nr:DNA repair protein RecO [Chitinophagaceae bacterium]